MTDRRSSCCGAFLGLSVGDAMGYPADSMTLSQIHENYGPLGLQGFDLSSEYVPITSYTQLAAYSANGLIFGLTRAQLRGRMVPFIRYISLAEKEWATCQIGMSSEEKQYFWVSQEPTLRSPFCMDNFTRDTLARGTLGSIAEPKNHLKNPGAITAAIPIGLFIDPNSVPQAEIDRLGAETIALTHGDPSAFLTGAILTHVLSRIAWGGVTDMWDLLREAAAAAQRLFGQEYPQAASMAQRFRQLLEYSIVRKDHENVMEWLHCTSCSDVLMGALYANLVSPDDFDGIMTVAVNHSGRSAAVGAVAGAIAGARLGQQAISDFYLDCLVCGRALRELAGDLYVGCPELRSGIFTDAGWDSRYVRNMG